MLKSPARIIYQGESRAQRVGREQFRQRLGNMSESQARKLVAYLCMEYMLHTDLQIYSGGLGGLAGCHMRAAADLHDPTVGVGILYRDGYSVQVVHPNGEVEYLADPMRPGSDPRLVNLREFVQIPAMDTVANLGLWGLNVNGIDEGWSPLLLLDAGACPQDRRIGPFTNRLYTDNIRDKIMQRVALGVGGVRVFEQLLGIPPAFVHANEGHAAFAAIELLRTLGSVDAVKRVFSATTHTPEWAGIDRFHEDDIKAVIQDPFLLENVLKYGRDPHNAYMVNMLVLAFQLSGYNNAVSKMHGEVSRDMFPGYPIDYITNGVHTRWVASPIRRVLDKYKPGWENNPESVADLASLSNVQEALDDLFEAHQECKGRMFHVIDPKNRKALSRNVLTFGFARRSAPYKRGWMLMSQPDRLLRIAQKIGGLQIVMAGKPHFNDERGKAIFTTLLEQARHIENISGGLVKVIIVENYRQEIGEAMVAGVDTWLNTPERKHEASGTSGQKASKNGVPHVSIDDGWWVERVNGDAGGYTIRGNDTDSGDAEALFNTLEQVASDYSRVHSDMTFKQKMWAAMTENGPVYDSNRQVRQYREKAFRADRVSANRTLESPPIMPAPEKLEEALADTVFKLGGETSATELHHSVAEALLSNLPCTRVTRYDVHQDAARISSRWSWGAINRSVFTEDEASFSESSFRHWRKSDEFRGEVMGDLLRQKKIQVISDPLNDTRCQRDGQPTATQPFILVPEIVDGEIKGVYKIDFRAGFNLEQPSIAGFVRNLIAQSGKAYSKALKCEAQDDLANYETKQELIGRALTLMVAGGFAVMRHAIQANRAVFFESTPEGLIGRLAIGDASEEERGRNFARIIEQIHADGVDATLKSVDLSNLSLSRNIAGRNIGINIIPAPILIENGTPQFDAAQFGSDFEPAQFTALRSQIEEMLKVDGKAVDRYLLMPVRDRAGKFLGLVYVDNAFSKDIPLSAARFRHLVDAFAQNLVRVRR